VLAGLVHLVLVPEHLKEMPALGVLFIVDSVALVAAGLWLFVAERDDAAWATAAVAGATATAYLVSRTIGLPVFGHEEWELLGVLTTLVEVAVALGATRLAFPTHPEMVMAPNTVRCDIDAR